MTNFVAVLDDDLARRSQFAAQVRAEIAPIPNLQVAERQHGSLAVLWAAAPTTPISIEQTADSLAVLWGEAIPPETSRRQTAADIWAAWQTLPGQPFDGYYAALTYQPEVGLKIGVDILGFFPIYYWQGPDVVIVASSPELLRYHPAFSAELSLAGLIGTMLMRSHANDQSLWEGVLRLGAGNLLRVDPTLQATEHRQYHVPCFTADVEAAAYHQLSFDEQIEVLAAGVDQAIARQAPSTDQQTLFLSGGMDSRTLAGFLHRQGTTPQPLTFGRADDIECLCARAVAKTLGWSFQRVDLSRATAIEQTATQACLANAQRVIKWDHLAGGGLSLAGLGWTQLAATAILAPRVISGLGMDRAIGGTDIRQPNFERALASESQRGGLSLPQVRRLFIGSPAVQDTITQVVDQLRQRYEQYSDLESRRAWLMSLYHGNRLCLGMAVWRLSFAAWPRLPILDQQLLAICGQLPDKTTAYRRAQREMVKRCFPDLAALPLDRNSFDPAPLIHSPWQKRLQPLRKPRHKWRQLQKRLGRDRRYYYRSFDINRPELQALRAQADPHRDKLAHVWHLDVLDTLMPSQKTIPVDQNVIQKTKSCLTLAAVLLWAEANL